MAVYTKVFHSGGTADGRGILIDQTTATGTTIHTCGASDIDEIIMYAFNTHTADLLITIEFGDVTALGDTWEQTIPFADGLIPVCPGLILSNSDVLRVFAASANLVTIFGYVNRLT